MLIQAARVVDPTGPHHGQIVDLRLTDGRIAEIGSDLSPADDEQVVAADDLHVSAGFVDLGAYLGEPGHEEREDITSLRAAAVAGGYTHVAVLPDTQPVRQTVPDVAYLLRQNGDHPTDLLPLAALSHDLAGKDMTEMLDLAAAGVRVFTDGPERPVSGSLLLRTLRYAQAADLTVMVSPFDPALAPDGQVHEGEVSVRLGLRGIPAISETIPLAKALQLLAYTGGKMIVHLLSTAAGVAAVRAAKAEGLDVRATVSAHHLCFTDAALAGFDPNFKMLPPLRGETDRQALLDGLGDGTIDAIVSNHAARHGEEKDLEFAYADFGALGLQTALPQVLAMDEGHPGVDKIVAALTTGPRQLLGLPTPGVAQGAAADLTLFRTTGDRVFTSDRLTGKTENSPLLDRPLTGEIVGVYHNGRFLSVEPGGVS